MEGEKFNICGFTYVHFDKKFKASDFQPHIDDLKATKRPYWYK